MSYLDNNETNPIVYLDNNATTCLAREVLEEMMQDLDSVPRNPSSVTKLGLEAKHMLFNAKRKCAKLLNSQPQEIIFTSGASEANNLAIFSMAKRYKGMIVTSPIEHPSILEPIRSLEKQGRCVHYLKIDEKGHVDPNELLNFDSMAFVALGAANSETGVMNPLEAISQILSTLDTPLVIDAVSQFSKAPLNLEQLQFHALTLSGHKIHGPKGSGLAIFKKHKPTAMIYGGQQEYNARAGTENLPAILGMTKAIEMAKESESYRIEHMQNLKTHFEKSLKQIDPSIKINGTGPKVSNTTNVYFPNQDGQTLLVNLDQRNCIASMGSACAASALTPSHVLQNMYANEPIRAKNSLRFSFCYQTTKEQVEYALTMLKHLL